MHACVHCARTAFALAVAAAFCAAGGWLASAYGASAYLLPIVTGLTVSAATLFPSTFAPLAPAGEAHATLLLHVFFAAVGAMGSVRDVVATSPVLFAHSLLAIGAHLALVLLAGRALGMPLREVLLASNANVGGPGTAVGMATSKGWRSLAVPAVLAGTLGYAVATFVAIWLGQSVLRRM